MVRCLDQGFGKLLGGACQQHAGADVGIVPERGTTMRRYSSLRSESCCNPADVNEGVGGGILGKIPAADLLPQLLQCPEDEAKSFLKELIVPNVQQFCPEPEAV